MEPGGQGRRAAKADGPRAARVRRRRIHRGPHRRLELRPRRRWIVDGRRGVLHPARPNHDTGDDYFRLPQLALRLLLQNRLIAG